MIYIYLMQSKKYSKWRTCSACNLREHFGERNPENSPRCVIFLTGWTQKIILV